MTEDCESKPHGWISASFICAWLAALVAVAYSTYLRFPFMSARGYALMLLAMHLVAISGIACATIGRSWKGAAANMSVVAAFWTYRLFSQN